MAAQSYLFEFTVEGRGAFPLDMLRYDSCHPRSSDDVAGLDSPDRGERKVTLLHIGPREWHPTGPRWSSFGWVVISNPPPRKVPW